MKKLLFALLVMAVLAVGVTSPVNASHGQPPIGSCPSGFMLETIGSHELHDHHVGLKVDLNNDNQVCVKHLSSGLHVHMDNVVR